MQVIVIPDQKRLAPRPDRLAAPRQVPRRAIEAQEPRRQVVDEASAQRTVVIAKQPIVDINEREQGGEEAVPRSGAAAASDRRQNSPLRTPRRRS